MSNIYAVTEHLLTVNVTLDLAMYKQVAEFDARIACCMNVVIEDKRSRYINERS